MISKSFALISIIVLLGVGILFYTNFSNRTEPAQNECTLEAKICPDGSSVGRSGPNCEFDPCPEIKDLFISSIDPASGEVGQVVTLKGTVFGIKDLAVKLSKDEISGYINNPTTIDETTIQFTVPDGYDLCAPGQEVCPQGYGIIESGTHNIQVVTKDRESNVVPFVVVKE